MIILLHLAFLSFLSFIPFLLFLTFLPYTSTTVLTILTTPIVSIFIPQGIVDNSASKPALRQGTGYMVEKTYYDMAP